MALEPHEWQEIVRQGQTLGRLDARLDNVERIVADKSSCMGHDKRLRKLESVEDRRTGAMVIISGLVGAAGAWLSKHFGI